MAKNKVFEFKGKVAEHSEGHQKKDMGQHEENNISVIEVLKEKRQNSYLK